MKRARIIGMGSYLPSRVLTNKDLEKMVDTSDEWIVSRTGISERRLASDEEFPSTMGIAAAEKALQQANLSADEIDCILVATMSGDYVAPSTANLIQSGLKAKKAAAMDIQAACTGFLYALSVAKSYVESGMYKNVLVVASEKMSAFIDYEDRSTCVLFGDGAGSVVVSSTGSGLHLDAICLGSDGDLATYGWIPAGGSRSPASLETVEARSHFFKMSGNEVFKHAVRRMSQAASECLEKACLDRSKISWLVPHQANKRIVDAVAKYFDIEEDKVFLTLQKYGNTSASSVIVALNELSEMHSFKDQEHILLVAFGVGFTWGAALLTFATDPA